MNIANTTNLDYWFGPVRLPANGSITLDDITDTSLYLLDDAVADAINALVLSSKITVTNTNPNSPFPRPTGTPQVLHGDGAPEGLVYASQGSLFLRRDNSGATDSVYAKTSGVDVSTGWSAVGASGIFAVGSAFPVSPAKGAAFVYQSGSSFISFIYDGTHWYNEPFRVQLVDPNDNITQTDVSSVAEITPSQRRSVSITDVIAAGCTVQLSIESYMQGQGTKNAHLQPAYFTAATGGSIGGITYLSLGETYTTSGGANAEFQRGPWADGPTTGDGLILSAGGYRDSGGSGATMSWYDITIWVRFKK